MIRDGGRLSDGSVIEADLCIIGAGAAGLVLARAFIGQGLRVVVLESGATEYHPATQALYEGRVTGQGYPALDICRLRFFGGTTNHWGGYCRPMGPSDFTSWPIDLADVAPFYEEAFSICQFGGGVWNWDESFWRKRIGSPPPLFAGSAFDYRITQITPKVTQSGRSFGEFYREEIEQSDNVVVFMNSNVVEFELDTAGQLVTAALIRTFEGAAWRTTATCFVLCCGGIENARLLLASNRRAPAGLGNHYDLVGRFFADHVYFTSCRIVATNRWDPLLNDNDIDYGLLKGSLVPSDSSLDETIDPFFYVDRILDPFYAEAARADGVASLRKLLNEMSRGQVPDDFMGHLGDVITDLDDVAWTAYAHLRYGGLPVTAYEGTLVLNTVPDAENRVTLVDEKDALGIPRARLHWRLGEREWRAAHHMTKLLATELGRLGIGRAQILLAPLEDERAWPEDLGVGYHHVGTTKMGGTEREGVVDRDCKVYGTSNLYIAGSSVFPTHGSGTPTMTLVALTLRLAQHLKRRVRRL